MKRRQFLTNTTVLFAWGCSARDPLEQGQTSKRTFPANVQVAESEFPQSVASGDPKSQSVVLWTRCPKRALVFLQVARDEQFEQLLELSGDGQVPEVDATVLRLTSEAQHDHCVKVRVKDLTPATTYYYRFVVDTKDGPRSSRTGRTKTAPRSDSDETVRFVVLSCQDYSGRYFHSLRHAAGLKPDFVVHLGDYIYETTDDPRFQETANHQRTVTFRDIDGAQASSDDGTIESMGSLAARSRDNYRQLYQEYRSDPDLQRLHETAPFIAVWDDHEFANDATRDRIPALSEADPLRRSNADRAWFEYMPVDFEQAPSLDDGVFPDNLIIYRDFRFGQHVHLVMTDLRRFRPPPLIAEDTFPGSVLVQQMTLLEMYDELPTFAQPYIDLDVSEFDAHQRALRAAAPTWTLAPEVFSGHQDLTYLNTWVTRLNEETGTRLRLFTESDAVGKGIAAVHVGKNDLRSGFGARYFVIQDAYEAVALAAYSASNGESENLLGTTQREWFLQTLGQSNATWKVWGNEYTLLNKVANLTPLPLPDPNLRHRFLISVDDWDGVPNERLALLTALQDIEGLVVVTGDIHSFFVGSTGLSAEVRQPIEFVCGAVSSSTYESLLAGTAALPGAADIAPYAGAILKASNPHVVYQDLVHNGFAWIEASKTSFDVAFHQLPSAAVLRPTLEGNIADHFSVSRHSVDRSGRLTEMP